ncbi:MAG TPA: hypothetical protein VJ617_00045 [Arthrobacter sp.]|nr:hypothetical protein [Arthrobacter sp.]
MKRGDVPLSDVPRYRRLMVISELLDTTGNLLGNEFYIDAMKAWALSSRYRSLAEDLRRDKSA